MEVWDWFKNHMTDYVEPVDERTLDFFKKNEHIVPDLGYLDDEHLLTADPVEIMDNSKMPWIPTDIPVPVDDILDEALRLLYSGCFTFHRPDGSGWMSLAIHGLSSVMTGVLEDYGMSGDEVEQSDWTDIAKYCPKTVQWMNDEIRYRKFGRVRFMALLPGGSIGPHNDRPNIVRGIGATNVAINNPAGCDMVLEGVGKFPWRPGLVSKINTGYQHSVWNRSEEPRIHMIFDGHTGDYFNNKVREGYIKLVNDSRNKR